MPTILAPLILAAGWATADPARVARGRELYAVGCASCHGPDGRGNPGWESAVRPPNLSDCGTTAETAEQWETIVTRGGPARGLSSVMPAFGEAFTPEEIAAIVAFLRTLCPGADRYPPGELNFRRPLQTGKAFPESEVVLRASHRPDRATREAEVEVAYENRLGPRFQYELVLPFRSGSTGDAGAAGIADMELEVKQVLHADLRRQEIFSVGLGLAFPTGSEAKGLGRGTVSFAPFLAYGRGWGPTVLQAHLEASLPADTARADREIGYAVALSRALGPARIAWTPALEWVGSWNAHTKTHDYAAWVEVSKPLSKLGHVIASLGVQVPLHPRRDTYRIEAYLLWDFGDGPFWAGW